MRNNLEGIEFNPTSDMTEAPGRRPRNAGEAALLGLQHSLDHGAIDEKTFYAVRDGRQRWSQLGEQSSGPELAGVDHSSQSGED